MERKGSALLPAGFERPPCGSGFTSVGEGQRHRHNGARRGCAAGVHRPDGPSLADSL